MKKSTLLFIGILLGMLLSFPCLDARTPAYPDEDPATAEQAVKKVKAFPNPSDGRFTLSFEYHGKDGLSAKVFDITGKLVKDITDDLPTGETIVRADVDLQNPGPGIYFIRFKWEGSASISKIMVR